MKEHNPLFYELLGIEQMPVSHIEKLVSAIGGFIAIVGIFFISNAFIGSSGAHILIASMGASAVLLFAVPHGPLSQPWAVLGGHLISAFIGVSCAQFIGVPLLAAGLAVGLAIAGMYYLRCIHPPGGATALSAVIGGESVQALGYQFILTPVLLNVFFILIIAIGYNLLFSWRQYPIYLQRRSKQKIKNHTAQIPDVEVPEISHADFMYALRQVDSFVDVSEYELIRIYEMAITHLQHQSLTTADIKVGHAYSNGAYGHHWSVRQVTAIRSEPEGDKVDFKGLAGQDRRQCGSMSRQAFAQWAKSQVVRDEENWKKVVEDVD